MSSPASPLRGENSHMLDVDRRVGIYIDDVFDKEKILRSQIKYAEISVRV